MKKAPLAMALEPRVLELVRGYRRYLMGSTEPVAGHSYARGSSPPPHASQLPPAVYCRHQRTPLICPGRRRGRPSPVPAPLTSRNSVSRNSVSRDLTIVPTRRHSLARRRARAVSGDLADSLGSPKDCLDATTLGGPLSSARIGEVERAVLRAIGVP